MEIVPQKAQKQTWFFVLKVMHYNNIGWVLPESEVPESNIQVSLVLFTIGQLDDVFGQSIFIRPPALCVEMGFTWTFPRNQDATVKLRSELISIKFYQFFNTLANPKLICPIQTILLTCKL